MTGTENHKRQKLVPIHDQIFRLESEGIRFDLHGKRDAEHYLSTKCNSLKFFHTALFSRDLSQRIRSSTNQTSLNLDYWPPSINVYVTLCSG